MMMLRVKQFPLALVGAMATSALLLSGMSGSAAAGLSTTPVNRSQGIDQPLRVLAKPLDLRVGTAVDMSALANDAAYRARVSTEFSAVTAENVMKWETLEPTRGVYNWGPADQLVDFAQSNGQKVHGHVLLWHNQLPGWLTAGVADGSINADQLRTIVRDYITTVVSHFRGKIWHWDVVNEAFTDGDNPTLRETIFSKALGPNYIADALRWAHAADPKAGLWLNDYAIDNVNAKSTAYYELAKQLLAQHVPLTGMGFQGHLDLQYPIPTDAVDNLRRFDQLGLDTGFTEVDVRYNLPGDTYKTAGQVGSFTTLMQACLLTPHCEMFTLWGFTDKYSWIPGWFSNPPQGEATPLDANFQPKPAYRALQQTLALAGGSYEHHT
jgi:endo-1,4-beta-xylanase